MMSKKCCLLVDQCINIRSKHTSYMYLRIKKLAAFSIPSVAAAAKHGWAICTNGFRYPSRNLQRGYAQPAAGVTSTEAGTSEFISIHDQCIVYPKSRPSTASKPFHLASAGSGLHAYVHYNKAAMSDTSGRVLPFAGTCQNRKSMSLINTVHELGENKP